MENLITLEQWNEKKFNGRYTQNTLRNWAREGLISPSPEKIGRDWLVQSNAIYKKKLTKILVPKNIYIEPHKITDPLALKILNSRIKAA